MCYTAFCCCGGPTRTGDLQVMSLASYQLLHSAMFVYRAFGLFPVCECKVTAFLAVCQTFCAENAKKATRGGLLQNDVGKTLKAFPQITHLRMLGKKENCPVAWAAEQL